MLVEEDDRRSSSQILSRRLCRPARQCLPRRGASFPTTKSSDPLRWTSCRSSGRTESGKTSSCSSRRRSPIVESDSVSTACRPARQCLPRRGASFRRRSRLILDSAQTAALHNADPHIHIYMCVAVRRTAFLARAQSPVAGRSVCASI